MASTNSSVSVAIFSIALSVKFALMAGLPTQAQVSAPNPLSEKTVASITFEPPDNQTLEDSAGGASRSGGFCPQDGMMEGPSVTPILPETKQGLTLSDRPTVFAYIPPTSAAQGYFIVKDKTEDYYYQTQVEIPSDGGIISLTLPPEASPLETGKTYQWSFVLACENPPRADSPRVEGWITRTEASATAMGQLPPEVSLEAASQYGKEGIWYDTLSTLAELRRSQPDRYTAAWDNFLSENGLEAIANQPLIQSIAPPSAIGH